MQFIDKDTISIQWCTDDVKQQLKDRNHLKKGWGKKENLTLKECREVLLRCLNKHDASLGMSWDIMDIHIDDILEEKKQ